MLVKYSIPFFVPWDGMGSSVSHFDQFWVLHINQFQIFKSRITPSMIRPPPQQSVRFSHRRFRQSCLFGGAMLTPDPWNM